MRKELTVGPLSLVSVLVLGILLMIGCGEKGDKTVVGTQEIAFVTDYDSALAVARQKGQKVLIDFYTDWCKWCKTLDTITYVDSAVIEYSKTMVFAKINAEVDTLIAQKYKVPGYPTLVLTNDDGTEIDRIGGYLEPVKFLETLENYLIDRETLKDYLRRAETEATMEINFIIGSKYADRSMYDEAMSYFDKVIEADPKQEDTLTADAMMSIGDIFLRDKEYEKSLDQYKKVMKAFKGSESEADAMMSIGNVYIREKEYEKSLDQFKKVIKTFEGSESEADAMLWLAYAYRKRGEAGDTASAIKVYEDFLKKHPDSPDTPDAIKMIDRLKNPPAEEEGK